jgi:hypothetical protein
MGKTALGGECCEQSGPDGGVAGFQPFQFAQRVRLLPGRETSHAAVKKI